MLERLNHVGRVGGALVRTSLLTAMQYRSDFVLDSVTGILRTLAALATTLLVFGQVESVAGWELPDMILVVGLYFLMHALLAGLVEPNLGEIVEAIRTGTLDFVLLKPADAQLLASIRRVQPAPLWDLVGAVILIAWSMKSIPTPSALDVLVAVVLGVSGMAAMYGLWLLAICTSFFFVRVDNLRYLLWSVADAGRWPLPIFARWVQIVLVVVVPVGVITTFPAMALRGTWSAATVALGVGIGLLFVLVSRLAWKASLRSYTSASS